MTDPRFPAFVWGFFTACGITAALDGHYVSAGLLAIGAVCYGYAALGEAPMTDDPKPLRERDTTQADQSNPTIISIAARQP